MLFDLPLSEAAARVIVCGLFSMIFLCPSIAVRLFVGPGARKARTH